MLKSQLVNAGLFFTNYLQNAFLEEPRTDSTNQNQYDKTQDEVQNNKPPNLLKTIFESGRPYFRLDYMETLNNIRCLILPIGKVKQLVPDLYIPSVSASTFIIASSVLLCLKSKIKMTFGDALSKTLTKFVLVNLSEIFLLSVLLYFISYSNTTTTNNNNTNTSNTNHTNLQQFSFQHTAADLNQAYGPFVGYSNIVQNQGNFQQNTNNFGTSSGVYGTSQNMVQQNMVKNKNNEKTKVKLPDVLFIIGYKYFLVNYFLFITTMLPFKINIVISMIYVGISCLIFSVRSIKSLRSLHSNSSNPLIFIFPVLQPFFFYILLPSKKL